MTLVVSLLVLAVLAVPLVVSIARSTELFVLRVEDGTLHFVRGRMPPRLLEELRDVVRRSAIRSGTIKAVVEDGAPRVTATGLGEGDLQAVRNVVGTFRLAQIRAGRRPP